MIDDIINENIIYYLVKNLTEFKYNSSLSREDKYKISRTIDYTKKGFEENLLQIFKKETDIGFLDGVICDQLRGNDEFLHNVRINFLLDIIDKLEKEKKNILWELLLLKVRKTKNQKEKEIVLEKLKKENSFTKAYAINFFPITNELFLKTDWEKIFSIKNELNMYSLSMSNIKDQINKTIELIQEINQYESPNIYSDLENCLAPFTDYSIKEINKNLPDLLKNILNTLNFPENSQLIELYSDFSKIEAQFFPSFQDYRNHFTHSFQVFLLGFQFLIVKWEFNRKIKQKELLCWVFTAFFHDLGYGLQKLEKLSDKIETHYKHLGAVQPAQFYFSPSSRIFAEKIMDLMNEMVKPSRYHDEEYQFLDLSPILLSWDEKKHGLMSAIVFLWKIHNMISENYSFYKENAKDWDNIFYRSALAMAVHTYPKNLRYNLDIDLHTPRNLRKVSDPLFPSFLLTLIDEIEYFDRHKFLSFNEPDEFDRDIAMNLEMSFTYDLNHFMNVSIIIKYTKLEKKLEEVAKKIRDAFLGFHTQRWGISFTLIDPKGSKIGFDILRKEQEEFKKYLEEIEHDKITTEDTLYNFYEEFYSKSMIKSKIIWSWTKNWPPERVSFQILQYFREHKHSDEIFRSNRGENQSLNSL